MFVVSLACLLIVPAIFAQSKTRQAPYSGYLFAYFTGNTGNEEAIRFAVSNDGYRYLALNGNEPVIASAAISETGGVRDPHILRGADGKTFYMVVTDMVSARGWNSNRGMVLLKSTDLVNWTASRINFQKRFAGNDSLLRVWAPQTIYDKKAGKYMIYFSLKHGKDPDKIYYAYANETFTDLESEPKQLFFNPGGGACIDGDIVEKKGKFYLFFKTEDAGAGLKVAVSDKLTEGYALRDRFVQQTTDPVEGSSVFKLNDGTGYILMYDVYTKGAYQFTRSTDLERFTVIDQEISMNFHPRHGTVMPVTDAEYRRLVTKWMRPEDVLLSVTHPAIKKINIALDTASKRLILPVAPGTDLTRFQPRFMTMPGVSAKAAAGSLAQGPITYIVGIEGQSAEKVTVEVKEAKNPILPGYYADPEVMYSHKTGKYYIYPTSDGFNNWSGYYFKTFSSTDLVHWNDEGIILTLGKDVSWANRNAWAPCIIEKNIDGQYKYFYYFTAAQKIGVAIADNPTGPFRDLGRPLIDQLPPGVKGGQNIDPDVFTDPHTGRSYLYWGNGFMAGVELNADMTSIKPETLTILNPGTTFREGTEVFFRNGRYYFLWSENDTRDADYRVRYGMAASPLGPIQPVGDNLILAKDAASGVYGTGHNCVLQVPGKDEWYIIYHRFNRPQGIHMGRAAGFHREVCIDPMTFDANGNIIPVKPSAY